MKEQDGLRHGAACEGNRMMDRDSARPTTAVVPALWRVPWIWHCFVHFPMSASEAPDRTDPHIDPLHHAQTLVCGGGTTAKVGEAVCAMLARVLGQWDQEGEDGGAEGGSLGATETWEK